MKPVRLLHWKTSPNTNGTATASTEKKGATWSQRRAPPAAEIAQICSRSGWTTMSSIFCQSLFTSVYKSDVGKDSIRLGSAEGWPFSDVGVMLGKKRWRILRSLFTLLKSQVSASLWMGVSTSRGCTFRAIHMASHRGWTSVEVLSWCQVFSQSNKQSSTRPKNFYCMWEALFCHFL